MGLNQVTYLELVLNFLNLIHNRMTVTLISFRACLTVGSELGISCLLVGIGIPTDPLLRGIRIPTSRLHLGIGSFTAVLLRVQFVTVER